MTPLVERGYEAYDTATAQYVWKTDPEGLEVRVLLSAKRDIVFHIDFAADLGKALVEATKDAPSKE